jgi:hypothetical protein
MNPFPRSPKQLEDQAQQEQELLDLLKANPDLLKQYQEQLTKLKGTQKPRAAQQPMGAQ